MLRLPTCFQQLSVKPLLILLRDSPSEIPATVVYEESCWSGGALLIVAASFHDRPKVSLSIIM